MRTRLILAASLALLLVSGCGSSDNETQDRSLHPVAGNFEQDDTQLGDCSDAPCFEQAYGNLAYKEGPKAALAEFEQGMRTNQIVESDCHRIAHTIGSAALARLDGNVAKAFAEGAATCWSGYYHGILERSFVGADSRLEMGSIARSVCEDDSVRATTWLAYQCVHGLGHGLMIQSGYNLELSLSICDDLRTEWDQTSCHGGTFMENLSSSYGVKSRWLKDDDLVYPCDAVQDRYEGSCYLLVTSRILQATGYDWKQAARLCAGVEAKWVPTCFQSFGRDASGFTRQNAGRIIELCALAAKGRTDCIYGAARDITANDADGARAGKMCRQVLAADRDRCFEGVGTIIGTFHIDAEGRRAACAEFGTRDAPACLRGAGVPV